MRIVRSTIGTLLAATLLTLSIGLQVLEASGRWDQTLQDTGDEAVIVAVVLCIGAALVVAAIARPRISLSEIRTPVVIRFAAVFDSFPPIEACSPFSSSPPLSLRI
jgi:hypothetical protein